MKKIILMLAVLSSSIASAQAIPQLKLSPNGFEPIVVDIDKPANELYKKALNWVQETYQNPDKVLVADIPNEKIRVSGVDSGAWIQKVAFSKFSHTLKYNIEISFKDGKYRVDYTFISLIPHEAGQTITSPSHFFNKKGEARYPFKSAVPSIQNSANNLNKSLYNYLSGATEKVDSDW